MGWFDNTIAKFKELGTTRKGFEDAPRVAAEKSKVLQAAGDKEKPLIARSALQTAVDDEVATILGSIGRWGSTPAYLPKALEIISDAFKPGMTNAQVKGQLQTRLDAQKARQGVFSLSDSVEVSALKNSNSHCGQQNTPRSGANTSL